MATEPDNRPPPPADKEPDWDNLDASYEAPGARDVVPDMPPIPDVTTMNPPKDNWVWTHVDTGYHEAQKPFPIPNRKIVTEEDPLEVDVFFSMRSPYSYLALYRLVYLHSNYNVNVNFRVIFPIAARTSASGGSGGKSSLAGRWYYFYYSQYDAARTGRYEGIPFRFASPDPIVNDVWPPGSSQAVAPLSHQPYITWLVRLGNAAELEGKALEYCLAVSPLIFGARAKLGEWPFHVADAVNSIGMNYDNVIEDIQSNPDKYDAVWQQNQVDFQATGQGGVPTMSFNGEPFFGQDRFNQFFWRLRQNGLTARKVPREPIVAKPLRWPSRSGGD
ncbi:MAG: DsbA family protein [marine benthic group bacterium]|nr:DsbA family protein [Gemmatimonadota bacterium]